MKRKGRPKPPGVLSIKHKLPFTAFTKRTPPIPTATDMDYMSAIRAFHYYSLHILCVEKTTPGACGSSHSNELPLLLIVIFWASCAIFKTCLISAVVIGCVFIFPSNYRQKDRQSAVNLFLISGFSRPCNHPRIQTPYIRLRP